MSDDLKLVKDVRPDVPAPTAAAREAARARLRAAVVAEGDRPPQRVRGRVSRWLPSAGALTTVAALLVTVVIAVGAVVLLGHTRHLAGHRTTAGQAAGTRGEILDRTGDALAGDRREIEVLLKRSKLPNAANQAAMLDRLAGILGISTRPGRCHTDRGYVQLPPVQCEVQGSESAGEKSVVVATDVSATSARELTRESATLPGVSTKTTTERTYPGGNLAAQAIGTVGDINAAELKASGYRGVSAASVIGQSGLEAQYDSDLRAGDTLHTSLDAQLQKTGQRSLQHAISSSGGTGGAFVAMNPQTGSVYALGSAPSFDPSVFTGRLSSSTYRALTTPASGEPLLNRAIQSAGPTGSTFKPITALAALQSGAWRTDQTFDDNGQFCVSGQCRHNSGHVMDGVLTVSTALKAGSDDFFYDLGAHTNAADPAKRPDGGALDQWATAFGIGQSTGIDLPGGTKGTLPTPRWRAERNRLERECDTATGPFKGRHRHQPGGCGIADGTNRPWSVGDNESLAVGQGDLQISPMQLAVAYAAIANGGDIVQPHLATAISAPVGSVLRTINPPAKRHLNLNPTNLAAVRNGLRDAAAQPGGTSDDVFRGFPQQVYGQAGSAQYITNGRESNYAWYAGYVPASATNKPIVVVVWVQQGGFGDVTAAPAARQLFSQWLLGRTGPWQPGRSTGL